jgi:drug/metabolite transporter (DMT)-like permease
MLKKLTTPLKIGLFFGLLGIAFTVTGIVRGNVPLNPASIGIALLIGGGVWFLVAWAVAAAAVDVEQDVKSNE